MPTLDTLPPELVHQIILKLNVWSDQCCFLDLLNTFIALDLNEGDRVYRLWFCRLIELFRTQIQVVDFVGGGSGDSDGDTTTLLSFLRKHFVRDGVECMDSISNLHKLVLIVDGDSDDFIDESTVVEQFARCGIRDRSIFERVSVDVFVCCRGNKPPKNIPALLKVFDPHFKTFNNLILEFRQPTLTASRDFMGILTKDIFVQIEDTSTTHPVPRFSQLSIPTITELNMDYLTVDSFIDTVLDLGKTCSIGDYFTAFISKFHFYLPNLQAIRFYNYYRNEETCNFIDLSTPTLRKFKDSGTSLRHLFDLHSFTNWIVPSLQIFTGHRFKYDEVQIRDRNDSSNRNSSSDSNSDNNNSILQALSDNLCLLHELALRETQGSSPYFKVNLVPGEHVAHTRLLNWLPSESPNIFGSKRKKSNTIRGSSGSNRSNRSNGSNFSNERSLSDRQFGQFGQPVSVTPYATALSNNSTTRDDSGTCCFSNDIIISYLDKPTICFENGSLKSLELKMMSLERDSARTSYIQGLFLKNLEELTLQDCEPVSQQQQLQAQRQEYPSSLSSQAFIVPGGGVKETKEDLEESEIDDISPIGFSSWNDLPSCEYIHFSSKTGSVITDNNSHGKLSSTSLQLSPLNTTYTSAGATPRERQQYFTSTRTPFSSSTSNAVATEQVTYLFKIKNLKMVLPKINLRGSFENFIDERQKYIIV